MFSNNFIGFVISSKWLNNFLEDSDIIFRMSVHLKYLFTLLYCHLNYESLLHAYLYVAAFNCVLINKDCLKSLQKL